MSPHATALGADHPLPYHLASNANVARSLRRGDVVRVADVVEPHDRVAWPLRREQDEMFLG